MSDIKASGVAPASGHLLPDPLTRAAEWLAHHPVIASCCRTGVIVAQLALLVAVVAAFEILNQAFIDLCMLVLVAFPVSVHLPRRYHLAFFLACSVAGLVLVVGLMSAAWIIGLGLGLIALCHLPVPLRWRVVLVIVAGAGLATLRWASSVSSGAQGSLAGALLALADRVGLAPGVVLPILASMFMFRIIVYLYDLRPGKPQGSALWTPAYFFLLPNVCFPLFPLVDQKQFRVGYLNQDPYLIYQRGIDWMFRGIYHLILYRIVYIYFSGDPAEVAGSADLIQYSVSSFLLYLRVSGTFHLAIGMLLLFGFNLPETHHRYYLASSFTDFWRRINIYWKDFMRRIVFFPVHFRLRRFGARTALAVATCVVFVATWALHSYQYFWLTGTLLLEPHDALFWAILGVLVAVNVLYEERFGPQRTWGPGRRSIAARTALGLRTLATFIVLTTLWGLWSSDSLAQWLAMWSGTGPLWLILLATVLASYTASFLIERRDAAGGAAGSAAVIRAAAPQNFAWHMALPSGCGAAALLLVGWPAVYANFGPSAANMIETIREAGALNKRDRNKLEKGYYEHLMSPNVTTGLWEVYTRKSPEKLRDTVAWRPTYDVLEGELVPGSAIIYRGGRLTVNSHGMRDREYSLHKPAGTTRLAFLGTSHTMGVGVNDDEPFEAVLEELLNQETPAGSGVRYELLNFGVGGYTPLQYLYLLEHRIAPFDVDYVVIVGHLQDRELLTGSLANVLRSGRPLPWPDLAARVRAAGVDPDMPASVIERRLRPVAEELLASIHARIVAEAHRQGAVPVWVFLPIAYQTPDAGLTARLQAMRAAGFVTLSLAGAFDGYSPKEVQVSDWDTHPNAHGHRLLARRLQVELRRVGVLGGPGGQALRLTPVSPAGIAAGSNEVSGESGR